MLRKFVRSAQLQKTKGFKSSQPVIVTFGINDRTEKTNTKFSINPDRMGNKMRELAELTVIMFEKEEKLSKTTFEGVESIDYKGRVLMVNKILKEVKETKLIEQPVINAVENMQIISPDVTIEVVG